MSRFLWFSVYVPANVTVLQGGPKIAHFLYAVTSSNINRFSKLFHCPNQENMCNNTITNDPTTPRVSLHYLVKCVNMQEYRHKSHTA